MKATANVCETHGKKSHGGSGRNSRASFLHKSGHVHSPAICSASSWLTEKETIMKKETIISFNIALTFFKIMQPEIIENYYSLWFLETRLFVRIDEKCPQLE